MLRAQVRYRESRWPKALVLFGLLGAFVSAHAEATLDVDYSPERGALTLRAEDAPLHEVLSAIEAATDVEIVTRTSSDAPITIELTETPLQDAFERLLGERNYTIALDPQTQLPVKVWLMTTATPETLARLREARRLEAQRLRQQQAEQRAGLDTSRPSDSAMLDELGLDPGDAADLAQEVRAELRALSEDGSERQVLEELGLNAEEQDELLWMLDEMQSGSIPLETGR